MRPPPETPDPVELRQLRIHSRSPRTADARVPTLNCATADSTGRPGRVRPRGRAEMDDKLKKPVEGVRKKAPPARKAPARGRYVDEYARAPR